jgi:hypothetical protein
VTEGHVHDITQAETLTAQVQPEAVLAERATTPTPTLPASGRARSSQSSLPKANRKNKRGCNFALYRERNVGERFFQFIKHFRVEACRALAVAADDGNSLGTVFKAARRFDELFFKL